MVPNAVLIVNSNGYLRLANLENKQTGSAITNASVTATVKRKGSASTLWSGTVPHIGAGTYETVLPILAAVRGDRLRAVFTVDAGVGMVQTFPLDILVIDG